jgi:1-acyl-sn-glycerol-3-phosphate acyltransferase
MNPWCYEPVVDPNQSLLERLRKFPREPDMIVYGLRSITALLIRGWIRAYHRLTIVGSENLPSEGSFVLVANHASHLDALCLSAALPLRKLHRVFPVAAADYFFANVPRVWIATVVINALPFSREVNVRQSLALCDQLLKNPGNILIIFPEGTRSKTGDIGRFKPGIGMLLAGSGVPVIPCFLEGAFRAWPKGRFFPWPTKITLRIGPPKQYAHFQPGKESGCAIAADLQSAVQEIKDLYENG